MRLTPSPAFYRTDASARRTQPVPLFGRNKEAKEAKKKAGTEGTFHNLERKGRNFFVKKAEERMAPLIDHLYDLSQSVSVESPEYIDCLLKTARLLIASQALGQDIDKAPETMMERFNGAVKKVMKRVLPIPGAVETEMNNTQDSRLKDIIDSDEACVFIMNHDSQIHDPALLATFCAILYQGYIDAGKQADCPRPKIILNEDILNAQNEKHRAIYEKLGAVGIDASVSDKDAASRSRNSQAMMSVIKGFLEDKNHIFIFPEGRNAAAKNLPLEDKFQTGIGSIVAMAARKKKRVKVIPLGFAYKRDKDDSLGSVFIGRPVTFIPKGRQMYVDVANVDEEQASPRFRYYFHDEKRMSRRDFLRALTAPGAAAQEARAERLPPEPRFFVPPAVPYEEIDGHPYKLITSNHQPATGKVLSDCVADVLCENLRICREEAIEQLPESSLGEQVQRC